MNIYYTAKDIEELAGKGVYQLVIGQNIFLTDFAHETAEQLGIELVWPDSQARPSVQPAPAAPEAVRSISPRRYNKPRGCQHGASPRVQDSHTAAQEPQPQTATGENLVNRLADIVGKMIRRGD